jgi:predicted DNA-binding protein YlxM (UPF0122 family)
MPDTPEQKPEVPTPAAEPEKPKWVSKKLTDADKVRIFKLYFEENFSPKDIAAEYEVPTAQIYRLARTKVFVDELELQSRRLQNKKIALVNKLLDVADESIDRLNSRAEEGEVLPALKTAIDFGLMDRAGIGPKSSIDITHRNTKSYDVPDKDVNRANEVFKEIGTTITVEAEPEKSNVPEPKRDPEDSPDGA